MVDQMWNEIVEVLGLILENYGVIKRGKEMDRGKIDILPMPRALEL